MQSHFPSQVYIKDQADETYELMSQVTHEEAALIHAQLGVEVIDVDHPWEVKNHPGKIVFIKGDMFSNAILGEGNFSQFALARHVYTKKYVGVKIIRKEKAKRSSQQEYEFASHFKNTPYMLVPFASTNPTSPDEPLYMLTEVAALGTLEDVIEYLPSLPPELRSITEAQITKSILLILFNLENNPYSDKRFAHCDFHPGNVFIGAKGQLLLGDWGCTVELNKKNNFIQFDYQNGRWIGTGKKSYWSPARWEAVAAYENNNTEGNWFDANYEDRFCAAIIIAQGLLGKKIVKVNPSSHPPLTADAILNQLQAAGCNEKLTAIVEALLRKENPVPIKTLLDLKQMCDPALHLSDTHSAAFYLLKQAAIHAKPTEKHLYENKLNEKLVMKEDYHDSEEEAVEREDYHEVNSNNMPEKYDYHDDEIENKHAEPEDYHGLPTETELKIKLDGKREVEPDLTKDAKIIANFSEVISFKDEDNHEEDIQQNLEFDLQIVNWAKQYYAELVTFLKTELAASYIDLNAAFDLNDAESFDLHEFIKKWLQDAKAHTLVLMAEGGAGKTTYQKLLAALLAKELLDRLEKGERLTTLPLLIRLRDIQSPHAVIEEFLRKQGFSLDVIEYIRQHYRLNLLLDGYDEFKDKYDNFSITNEWHRWKLKSFYTTRRSNLKEKPVKYFLPQQKEVDVNVYVGYQELYLLPLDNAQIKKFINKYVAINEAALKVMSDSHRLNEKWLRKETYLEILNNIESANEILTKPYLLYLFLKTVPHLSSSQLHQGIRQIELYREYAKQTVNTNVDKFTDLSGIEKEKLNKDVLAYTQYLAEHFYEKNLSQLSFKIEFRFDAAKGDYQPKDASLRIFLQYYRYLPMNVSRLEDDKINVSFPHLTLLHYFIAESWLQQLSNLMPNKILTDDEVKKFFNASCFEKLKLVTLNQRLVATDVKARPILNFISEAIQQDEVLSEFLFRLVQVSGQCEGLDVLSANTATLLVLAKYDFSFKDLRGVKLKAADLRNMVANGADFEGADFTGTDMRKACFIQANFNKAILKDIITGKQPALKDILAKDCIVWGSEPDLGVIDDVACSRDGKWLATQVLKTVRVWNMQTGEIIFLDITHFLALSGEKLINFSPHSRYFAYIDKDNYQDRFRDIYYRDNYIKILCGEFKDHESLGSYWSYPKKEAGINFIGSEFSPQSNYLAVKTDKGSIYVYSLGRREDFISSEKVDVNIFQLTNDNHVAGMAISSDEKLLAASACNNVYLWELESKKLLWIKKMAADAPLFISDNKHLVFTSDNKQLVMVSNNTIHFYDYHHDKVTRTIALPGLNYGKICLTANQKYLIVANSNYGALLVDIQNEKFFSIPAAKCLFDWDENNQRIVWISEENKVKFTLLDDIIHSSRLLKPNDFNIAEDGLTVNVKGKNNIGLTSIDIQTGKVLSNHFSHQGILKKKYQLENNIDSGVDQFLQKKKDYQIRFMSKDTQWVFLSSPKNAGLEIWHCQQNKRVAILPMMIAENFDICWEKNVIVGMSKNKKQILCWRVDSVLFEKLNSFLSMNAVLQFFSGADDLSRFVKLQWVYSAGLTIENSNMQEVKGVTQAQAMFFREKGAKNIVIEGEKKKLSFF